MALQTAFRRFSLLPGFIQTGNGEPRKAHWLGNKQPTTPQQNQDQRQPDDRPPQPRDPRGYRELASLTLGEVDEAYTRFKVQLVPSLTEAWIAKNYFCQIPLKRRGEDRPPVVFGRLRTCYPSDGYVNNIEELEMYFPRSEAAPDLLYIHFDDIDLQKPTQSYCIGVRSYLSEEELTDFARSENIFIEKGFAPLYETSYIDLLDVTEQNQSMLPWLYVIGSGWLASIPDSVQGEVREQVRNLVRWGKTIFNYHPRRYSLQLQSLNEELGFQYGFTEHYLIAPQDTEQVLRKVEEGFGEIFMQEIE
jgi:hypothetical protein